MLTKHTKNKVCIKLVFSLHDYIEMHGQQNIKFGEFSCLFKPVLNGNDYLLCSVEIEGRRNVFIILNEKPKRKKPLGKTMRRHYDNIEVNLKA